MAVSSPEFVRVLKPADRWLQPNAHGVDARRDSFRGKADHDISVAMSCRCSPVRVLAALNGARREVVLDPPAYYTFTQEEVEAVGGTLRDTPATPPWPADYNHAHHDIATAPDAVAQRMAVLYEVQPERVIREQEVVVLLQIAELLVAPDVDPKFKDRATYRFRRMFSDGGDQRKMWIDVATHYRLLVEQDTVLKQLRKMYQNIAERDSWLMLMDDLGIPPTERAKFGGP